MKALSTRSITAEQQEVGAAARPLPRLALHHLALTGIVLLAAVLNCAGLSSEGYANTYYAAAVKSMSMNWHNFWFVAFDPAGFVTVDKPPLGLWLQVAAVKLFGFSGVSMLLPQAVAGLLSVVVLYILVARPFGRPAGLLAALALALTPVAVVDNRNNTSDSVLVCVLLFAAWAVVRAAQTGKLRWLLLGATLVGLGFNIKELEAYLVLPPLFLLYLVAAPDRLPARIGKVILAGIWTLAVSFAWIVSVDLTPAGQRPFVSDSGTNSELSLALGYNGMGRLATGLLERLPAIPFLHIKVDGSIVPGISMDIGSPGAFRLLRPEIGGQASWLLVAAVLGLALALPAIRRASRLEAGTLLFWATWLLAAGGFFSVARFYHLYYLIMLAPPVAALFGIGLARMWEDYRAALSYRYPPLWQGWLLPVALVTAGWSQAHLLSGYASWNDWLGPAIEIGCVLAAVALTLGRLGVRFDLAPDLVWRFDVRSTLAVTLAGCCLLMVAPASFAAQSAAGGNGAAWLPQAGPATAPGFGGPRGRGPGQPGGPNGFGAPGGTVAGGGAGSVTGSRPAPAGTTGTPMTSGAGFGAPPGFRGMHGGPGGFGGGAITFAGADVPTLNAGLVHYLEAHRGHARYLVATATSTYASLFILQTGEPVMTLGGYQGWDRILTLPQLKKLVRSGTVRFFLVSNSGAMAGPGALPGGVDAGLNTVNQDLFSWVTSACRAVPSSAYTRKTATATTSAGPGFGSSDPGRLYDCRGAA